MAKETKIKKTSIFQETEFTLGLIIVFLFVFSSLSILFSYIFCAILHINYGFM